MYAFTLKKGEVWRGDPLQDPFFRVGATSGESISEISSLLTIDLECHKLPTVLG
jgi:hypothetical protein